MNEPSAVKGPKLGRRRQLVVGVAAIGIVSLIAWPFVKAALRANDSEYTLHALICVSYVVEDCMKSHDGAWPSSWEDLKQTDVEHIPSMYDWPADAENVQQRVEIEFDVDEARLDDPDFKVTSVIHVKGDYIYDPATRLATLQEYVDHRRSGRLR